jgi:uncharacterized protein involved in exopolysaccharide biosynthesis
MEIIKIWRIIFSHRVMLIFLTVSATVTGVAITYLLPAKYEATALVLVRPKEDIRYGNSSSGSKEVLDFPTSQNVPIDAPSKTYIEVIKSPTVVERIVHALHLDEKVKPVPEGTWAKIKDYLKTTLKNWLNAIKNYLKYGEIINVDPFNKAVEEVTEGLSLEAAKNTYVFKITYRGEDSQEAADVANKAAEIFLDYQTNANHEESTQGLASLKSMLEDSANGLRTARAALQRFKEQNGTFSVSEEHSEQLKIITDLEIDLEKKETALASLLKKFKPQHVEVLRAEAEQSRLAHALRLRRAALEQYPAKERELKTLELNVKLAEDRYDFLRKHYEEAEINEVAGNRAFIRLVSPALPPLYPVKPIKWIYGVGAFMVALTAGIVWVLFCEYLHPRLRSVDDVLERLNLRVITTIPEMRVRRNT